MECESLLVDSVLKSKLFFGKILISFTHLNIFYWSAGGLFRKGRCL